MTDHADAHLFLRLQNDVSELLNGSKRGGGEVTTRSPNRKNSGNFVNLPEQSKVLSIRDGVNLPGTIRQNWSKP
jgi:hypothetical protein